MSRGSKGRRAGTGATGSGMTPMLPDRPVRVKRSRARAMLRRVKAKWLLVIAGPTLLLMRPGSLRDPARLAGLSDEYLFNLIKNGGATIGKPGMPAFGYHLTDSEIRDLIAYLRAMPAS